MTILSINKISVLSTNRTFGITNYLLKAIKYGNNPLNLSLIIGAAIQQVPFACSDYFRSVLNSVDLFFKKIN